MRRIVKSESRLTPIDVSAPKDRPEDSILLTSARVGPTLEDVTVEVLHDTLRALGVPRDNSDDGSDVPSPE